MDNNERFNQIWTIAWLVYAIVPIIVGIDKYFYFLVDWNKYVSPFVASFISVPMVVSLVGVLEVASGLLMFFAPVIASYMIAGLLVVICINLMLFPGYYDIILRDIAIASSYIIFALFTQLKEARNNRD